MFMIKVFVENSEDYRTDESEVRLKKSESEEEPE